MVKDYQWLPQAPRASIAIGSCPKCCKPHLSKTAYIQWARQCYPHPLHQEHLQRSRELKRTKWNCKAIMWKTIENHWKPQKSTPCPVHGRFCSRCKLCSNWGTLSSTCSSMSLSKLRSKLTMLVEWGLLGVRWHSDVAICKGPSRNILMPLEVEQVWTFVSHTQRKSPEVRLECIQTLGLKLVSLVRIYDLFIVAAWSKLEDVDGLPLITASTTRLPFIHIRSVGNQTAYSEDDHVNSVAPGTSSGWEEPKRTKRNCNAIIRKTHESPWTPWKTWVAL